MNKVIVIIPVYKTDLAPHEKISLGRCVKILHKHPVVFIKPQSLDISELQEEYGIQTAVNFEDSYFENIAGYNRLMLSADFYQRFIDYKYMLICQLDAYVFEDTLEQWCDKNYDYIGAPWLPKKKYFNSYWRFEFWLCQQFSKLFAYYESKKVTYFRVGNGGLSLRNVSLFRDICNTDREYIRKFLKKKNYHFAEDVYWGLRANHIQKRINIPSYREALSFSFELYPENLYRVNDYQLPFGCHAWHRWQEFWKEHIPEIKIGDH